MHGPNCTGRNTLMKINDSHVTIMNLKFTISLILKIFFCPKIFKKLILLN